MSLPDFLNNVVSIVVIFILLFPIGIISGIIFLVKTKNNPDTSKKKKYRWVAAVSFITPLVLPLALVILPIYIKGLFQPRYQEQVNVQEISALPEIQQLQIMHPELPDAILRQTNDIDAALITYGDTLGDTYIIDIVNGAPLWNCKVYFVNGNNVQPIDAYLSTNGCTGLYTDNKGNWYLVNKSSIYPGDQTKVYKLEGDKALYVQGLENMKYLDLYYDSNTNNWFGKTIKDTSPAGSDYVNEVTNYYKIDFGTN